MHYFIAASILALTVLPALLSLAARAGYMGALLPLRNWEMLIFLIGATVAGSWYAFSNVGTGFTPGRSGQPRGLSLHKYLPFLFLISAMVSTLTSGADLYQFWSMPFLALFVWLALFCGLVGAGPGGTGFQPVHTGKDARATNIRPGQGNPAPTLINAIQIAALLNAAMAFAQLFGFNPFFRPVTGGHFITGFFDNPNRFGAFMAIAFPLFFAVGTDPGGTGFQPVHTGKDARATNIRPRAITWDRPYKWFGIGLIGMMVLLSRSTFAILAMMGALFYFVYVGTGFTPVRRTAVKAVPTLIAAALAVTMIISVFLLDRPSRANLLRPQIYKKSVSIALERPIFGHGLGQFDRVFNSRPPEIKDPPRRITHAHNEYLELFVEQGLAGLVILIFFIWSVFHRGGSRTAQGRETLPLQASLIALMVNALGFYPMRVPLIALTAAVVLAGIQSPQRHGDTM